MKRHLCPRCFRKCFINPTALGDRIYAAARDLGWTMTSVCCDRCSQVAAINGDMNDPSCPICKTQMERTGYGGYKRLVAVEYYTSLTQRCPTCNTTVERNRVSETSYLEDVHLGAPRRLDSPPRVKAEMINMMKEKP